ncbi:MAG: hypothetical protein WCK95_22770 [Alphaproteobacteria bacterium]|jgi:hypothetical protein
MRTGIFVSQIAFLRNGDVVGSDAVGQAALPLPEDSQNSYGTTAAIA